MLSQSLFTIMKAKMTILIKADGNFSLRQLKGPGSLLTKVLSVDSDLLLGANSRLVRMRMMMRMMMMMMTMMTMIMLTPR